MKNFFIITCFLLSQFTRAQSPLDLSFGSSGIAQFPDFYSNHCVSASVQNDGRILCYYTSSVSCFGHFIFRLMPDGSMDTSFHVPSGYFTTPNVVPGVFYISGSGLPEMGQTFVRQTSTGDVVIGINGYSIFKRKANGDVDLSFGSTVPSMGYTTLNSSSASTVVNPLFDFYEDAAGSYYYASRNPNRDSIVIAKTNANGILDNTYGSNGVKTIAMPSNFYALSCDIWRVQFTSNGKILACGEFYTNGSNNDAFVAKFNLDGSIVSGFGTGGYYSKNNSAFDEFYAVTEYSNGDIYATCSSSSPVEIFTVKLNSNGVEDNTFGTAGKKSYPTPPTSWGNAYTVSIPYAYNTPIYTVVDCWLTPYNRHQSYHSITNTGGNNLLYATSGTWNPGVNYRIDQMVSQPDGKIVCFGSDSSHARILRYNTNKANGISEHGQSRFDMYQQGHSIIIKSFNDNNTSFKLVDMNGKLIRQLNQTDIQRTGNDTHVELPASIASGMYIFVMENKRVTQSLKISY